MKEVGHKTLNGKFVLGDKTMNKNFLIYFEKKL